MSLIHLMLLHPICLPFLPLPVYSLDEGIRIRGKLINNAPKVKVLMEENGLVSQIRIPWTISPLEYYVGMAPQLLNVSNLSLDP